MYVTNLIFLIQNLHLKIMADKVGSILYQLWLELLYKMMKT